MAAGGATGRLTSPTRGVGLPVEFLQIATRRPRLGRGAGLLATGDERLSRNHEGRVGGRRWTPARPRTSRRNNRPLDQLVLAEKDRKELAQAFFFTPLRFVDRVVMIATPHDGSPWAKRLVGRLGRKLVDFSEQDDERYQKILRDNPGAIKTELTQGLPTSVEMLEQGNPILVAERQLRIDSSVKVHSIIGTGHRMLRDGPADGIVPASSARHPDAVSAAYIAATHTKILRDLVTTRELKRILYAHLAESVATASHRWWPRRSRQFAE